MAFGDLIRRIVYDFLDYETSKMIRIKQKKIGIINRTLQLTVVTYVIGYAIIYEKGYQEFEDVESTTTTKLKGIVSTESIPDDQFKDVIKKNDIHLYKRVWDASDIEVPNTGNDEFFLTTNLIITQNQKLDKCPEDWTNSEWHCDPNNNTCHKKNIHGTGNGVETGKCVESDKNGTFVCEVKGWCPVQVNTVPLKNGTALLTNTKYFTVLIKNSINFPLHNVRRRNILQTMDSSYLKHCRYDPITDPLCPIFVLNDIVSHAEEDYDLLAIRGAIIGIIINWDCNLDYDIKYCVPNYSFRRLDDPNVNISKGWNFRYAYNYNNKRTIRKSIGIKFIVIVNGKAGKFNLIPLLINIGSGLGLLVIATITCDIIVLYICKGETRKMYRENIIQTIK